MVDRIRSSNPANVRGTALVAVAVVCAGLGFGCGDDGGTASGGSQPTTSTAAPKPPPRVQPSEPVVDTRTPEELVAAGRATYAANCIACHSMNPAADGALGPSVAGASLELLEARVMRGEYPEGYTPKRPSRVMVPLPHLEARLPELAAYLQSVE